MEWEFCRYDVLNDLSGQGMEQNLFINVSDVSGNYDNPFNILENVSNIIDNITIGLDIIKEYSHDFENKLSLNTQDKDDIYFYKGMIVGAYNYHKKSFDIKIKKINYDMNKLLQNHLFVNKGIPVIFDKLDKKTCLLFKESFENVRERTNEESNTRTKPIWIKDNQLEELQNLTNELVRIFKYHYEINLFFLESILREIQFYNIN